MKKYLKQIILNHLNNVFARKAVARSCPFDLDKLPMGYFQSFGSKNPDKIFYVIWCRDMGHGFFSNLSHVLCHLKIADEAGMIPVVDFQNFKTLYNEDAIVNETENAWEYYFKQVSPYSLHDAYESKNVFFCSGSYPTMSYSITQVNGLFEEVYKKYIFLQNHIESLLVKHAAKFNCRVLGVHFRGQEMKLTTSHSFPPTEQQMIKYTDAIIKKYNIQKIFLVTEEQGYLDLFVKRYGRKVVYTDSYRTYGQNAYNLAPREQHRYLLGLDVLIDAYLLARCHGLLCGDSNVSEYARFVNNKKYEFVYKIYNGVNSSNPLIARYLYGIKKILPSRLGGLSDKIQISESF